MTERQAARREIETETARVAREPDPVGSEGWTWNATMYQEGDGIDYPSDLGMAELTLRTLVRAHAPDRRRA